MYICEKNRRSMFKLSQIKELAREVGFDLCGVAQCAMLEDDRAFLQRWIEQGFASSLDYLKRNIECRADANRLVEGAKSVVVCAVAYKSPISDGYPEGHNAKVASFACADDYHVTIKQMLFALCEKLKAIDADFSARCFVDSAPIFEKRYAVEAGLGWIGRQSLLVTPQYGSFVLLGEVVMTAECDSYDTTYEGVGCGECRRCVEACPNGAVKERHIDTSRCISCATVECRGGEEGLDTHGWIYGCDECQSVCPYNGKAPYFTNQKFAPKFNPMEMNSAEIAEVVAEKIRKRR
jgi:epoxyqueuosine reductase